MKREQRDGCFPSGVRWVLLGLVVLGTGCAEPGVHPTATGSGGRRVLATARDMVDRRVIVRGACWDYINAVYTRAGYPESKRRYVYRTAKKGPYADTKLIRPGDWLYFVNHSYNDIEHSAVFVEWINRGAREARMLSYAGQNRREPGRYLSYDLRSVYTIIRPQP